MTIAVVVGVVCVLALVHGYAVWRLNNAVKDLSRRLLDLRARDVSDAVQPGALQPAEAAVPAAQPPPTPEPPPNPEPPPSRDDEPTQPVSVITRLPGPELEDVDLTAARVASVTLARPLIKVAAAAHGVRRALDGEHRMRIRYAMRQEVRRQRKTRRRSGVRQEPSSGWQP